MSNESRKLIADHVVGVAESIEELSDPYDDYMDPLEVKVEASLDGTLREVYLVLTVGGPHIEVALYAKRVDGYWGGEEHSCPVNNDAVLDELADHYTYHWDDNVVAG